MRVAMGSSGTAANTIRYDAQVLIQAAEARAKQYQVLGEAMRQLKQSFAQITALGPSFKGRGAEKIMGFYQAQETVVTAWLRLIEKQVAFLNGIVGEISDRNLGGDTRVTIPFLESELSIAYWRSRDVVRNQEESIHTVLNRISDLLPAGRINTEDVDRQLDKANKVQAQMSAAVRDLDRTLLNEYQQVISDVPQIVSLYSALAQATRQGSDVEPLHFNAEAFYHSEAYKIQSDLEKQTAAYLSFKKQQEHARKALKKGNDQVNPLLKNAIESLLIDKIVNDGVSDGAKYVLKDTVNSLWDMATSPVQTTDNIGYAATHPIKIYDVFKQALVQSFEKNMVHGNAYTRSKWITYAFGTLALSLVGTKEIDKIDKIAETSNYLKNIGKVKTIDNAIKLKEILSKKQFLAYADGDRVPYNTINSASLRGKLLKTINDAEKNGFIDYINNVRNLFQQASVKNISTETIETVKTVSNMNDFFKMKFGKSLISKLLKTNMQYDGQSIYKVIRKTDNNYLKKGYGVYLDALHSDHLEVIDKKGSVKYVLNLDGTLNIDKSKKALGRKIKNWR